MNWHIDTVRWPWWIIHLASPYLCRPAELGADIVAESLTKYINGHGDALGGSISTNSHAIYYELQRMMGVVGCCASPFNSFLILRGVQTLGIRMERHCDNAGKVGGILENKAVCSGFNLSWNERTPAA